MKTTRKMMIDLTIMIQVASAKVVSASGVTARPPLGFACGGAGVL